MVLNGSTTTLLVFSVIGLARGLVSSTAFFSAWSRVTWLLFMKSAPASAKIAMIAIPATTFSHTELFRLAPLYLGWWLGPCEAIPGSLAASSLASSHTVTPNLANERIIACKPRSSSFSTYSTRCIPANWYSIDFGMPEESRQTGRIFLRRSDASANSFTTFSDSVDCSEIARISTLQLSIASTISWLHIVAPSIPIWSIHTDTPAFRKRSTKSRIRVRFSEA